MNKLLISLAVFLLAACGELKPMDQKLARKWADHLYQDSVADHFKLPKSARSSIPVPEPIVKEWNDNFYFEYIEPKTGRRVTAIVMTKERDIVGSMKE
jgi:hypothetical protein